MKPFIPVALAFSFIACVTVIQEYWVEYAAMEINENTNTLENNVLKINDTIATDISSTNYTATEFSVTCSSASEFSAIYSSALEFRATHSSSLKISATFSSTLESSTHSSDTQSSASEFSTTYSSTSQFSSMYSSTSEFSATYSSTSEFSATDSSASEFSARHFSDSEFSTVYSPALDISTFSPSAPDFYASNTEIPNTSEFTSRFNRTARIINTDKSPILKALKNFWLEPLSDLPSSNIKRSGDLPIFESVHQSDKGQSNNMSNQAWKRLYMRLKSCIENCLMKHDCKHEDNETSISSMSNEEKTEENKRFLNVSLTITPSADIVSSINSNLNMTSGMVAGHPELPETSASNTDKEILNVPNERTKTLSQTNSSLIKSDKSAPILNSVNPDLNLNTDSEDNPFYKVFQNIWFQAIAPFETYEVVTKHTLFETSSKIAVVEKHAREENLIVSRKDNSCAKDTRSLKEINNILRKCQNDYRNCIDMCMLQHDSGN